MGKGSRSRTICIRFLMFVVGFPAVTSAARDLSSPTLLSLSLVRMTC